MTDLTDNLESLRPDFLKKNSTKLTGKHRRLHQDEASPIDELKTFFADVSSSTIL